MKKKIVFFDGDGTLWYPRKTKDKEKSFWVYDLPGDHKKHCEYLMLRPHVVRTLRKLKRRGIVTVILSAHPHETKLAYEVISHKVKYFKIDKLFDEVHPSKVYIEAKGEMILKILKERGLKKKDALMVGDNYIWDCKSALNVGVDGLLVYTEHQFRRFPRLNNKVKRVIRNLSELLDYV